MEDLIKEAVSQSDEFSWKLGYWVHTRNRMPDLDWLLLELVKVLGEEKVIEKLKE